VAIGILAGCGGSQPPISASGAMTAPEPQLKERHKILGYSGQVEYFKVPRDQKSITIMADGATGGYWQQYGSPGIGGRGSYVEATVPVKPGELLEVYVGGTPTLYNIQNDKGGFNGGGPGGYGSYGCSSCDNFGAGGGGASDVRERGTALSDRILVAGGGGGESDWSQTGGASGGAGGGTTGAAGQAGSGQGGGGGGSGGSQSAGGAGGPGGAAGTGSCGAGATGASGVLGVGGTGGNSSCNEQPYILGGGGGGGGYYGGGGGGAAGFDGYGGGGGGGSSYVEKGATHVTDQQGGAPAGNGYVVISWYGKRG
jgi:hypothetical protein